MNSLVVGGAERVIEALCLDLPAHDLLVGVGCLREAGPIGRSLAERGIDVAAGLAPRRRAPSQVWALRRFLKSRRPHVVYVLDHSNALFYGRLAARLLHLPQLCAIHRTRRADGRASLGRSDRMLMGLSHQVVAVSETHARYLAEEEGVDPRRLVVVHNGVDPSRFAPPLDGEARARRRQELGLPATGALIVQVAAFRPEKNHRLLLEALVRLSRERRPHLALVGAGDTVERVRDDVEELALRDRVHFLGHRDDVPSVLACADVLALSSHPTVETFPLCVLEAMAAHLPVVSTDVGSLQEMVEEGRTGLLVPPGQPVALAGALGRLLDEPGEAAAMGEAGRRRVEARFTREGMVSRTAKLIWELARRRKL